MMNDLLIREMPPGTTGSAKTIGAVPVMKNP